MNLVDYTEKHRKIILSVHKVERERYTVRKRIVLASVLMLLVPSFTADAAPWQGTKEIGPGVTITQVNGVALQPGKVVTAGNLDVLPGVIYLDNGTNDDALESSVIGALGSVDALRGWVLCAAELHAEALIKRGYADAIYNFPKDLPLHADVNGKVTQADAAWANKLRAEAKRYDQAATLARAADLPCTNSGETPGNGNYIRLTGKGEDGVERTLDVPDYNVVYTPVEYFNLKGKCAADLAKKLKEVQATPVDAKVSVHGGLATFTERDKAEDIARLTAQAAMLQAVSC